MLAGLKAHALLQCFWTVGFGRWFGFDSFLTFCCSQQPGKGGCMESDSEFALSPGCWLLLPASKLHLQPWAFTAQSFPALINSSFKCSYPPLCIPIKPDPSSITSSKGVTPSSKGLQTTERRLSYHSVTSLLLCLYVYTYIYTGAGTDISVISHMYPFGLIFETLIL